MKSETFASRLRTLSSSRREPLAAIFRKAEQRWPNPEDSVGRYIGKDNLKWIQVHIWEATGPARDVFNSVAPRIKACLDNAVEPIPSRVTWSMYMVGKAPSLASPFIIFCCEVSGYRRDVQNTIKESGILDSYPGIKTDNLPRAPGLPQLVSLGASGQPNHSHGDMITLTSQARSACGSQIFIDSNGIKSGSVSSTPVATIGGVIRLGANLYYTTAAHAVSSDPDSVDSDELLSAGDNPGDGEDAFSLNGNEDMCSAPDSNPRAEELKSWLHPGGLTDISDNHRYLKDEILRQWNLKSHHEAEDPLSFVTKAGELSPNSTGRIFMTSIDGETRRAGLDYALIEMSSRNHVVENVIQIGPRNESTVKVRSVAKSAPRDGEIVAVTARGTIKGWISGTPVYSSTPGKRSYCRMFKAILSGPLQKGDCGTWVVDATNGDLFGHVVLGSPGRSAALLIPFSDIFDDILSRVGESPAFPTARDDETSFRSTERRISPSSRDDALARFLRQTISSIRELPEISCGIDDGISKTTSVSPIGSEQQTKGFSDPLRVEGESDESTKQVFSETRGAIKRSNVSMRDDTTITKTNPGRQERTSQAAPDTDDRLGDVSEHEELTRFMAQNNVEPYWQHEKPREASGTSVQDNSSLLKDPTENASSRIHARSSRNRIDIPAYNEPLDPPEPPRDPKFQHVLSTFGNAPLRWENTELLDQALKEINLDTICREADEESENFISLARIRGDETKPEWGYQDCVIRALSKYFRQSFFTRIKKPSCDSCPSKLPTSRRHNVRPTPGEKAGRAEVVELYQCAEQHCQDYTRFPRYWDPKTLLLNPRGRAGESANCFGLLCRALGSRVRWVWNAEDNIWIEVFSEHQRRWVHVDPFEDAWDDPLLYTETMGKKMSYCIAFSLDGVTDVTRRYVRSFRHALARTRCSERELLHIIHSMKSKRRINLSEADLARLESEDKAEEQELESYLVSSDETGPVDQWHPAEVKVTERNSGIVEPKENSVSIH